MDAQEMALRVRQLKQDFDPNDPAHMQVFQELLAAVKEAIRGFDEWLQQMSQGHPETLTLDYTLTQAPFSDN